MSTCQIELSQKEPSYILGLLKQHVDYYREISGTNLCAPKTRAMYEFVEAHVLKLAQC
jgi:hypothetical protein